MIFSSYSGSVASNFGYTATYDDYGFLYAGGTAYNIGYPITVGAYQTAYNGGVVGNDVVLSKYDTTGTFMAYSTYLGGSGDEVPHSLLFMTKNYLLWAQQVQQIFLLLRGLLTIPSMVDRLWLSMVGINYTNGCDIFISR